MKLIASLTLFLAVTGSAVSAGADGVDRQSIGIGGLAGIPTSDQRLYLDHITTVPTTLPTAPQGALLRDRLPARLSVRPPISAAQDGSQAQGATRSQSSPYGGYIPLHRSCRIIHPISGDFSFTEKQRVKGGSTYSHTVNILVSCTSNISYSLSLMNAGRAIDYLSLTCDNQKAPLRAFLYNYNGQRADRAIHQGKGYETHHQVRLGFESPERCDNPRLDQTAGLGLIGR